MFLTIRNDQHLGLGHGGFQITRIRPGLVLQNADDPGLGPLSLIDRMTMSPRVTVPMHLHRNDEIFTYIIRGMLVHKDDKEERQLLTPDKFMMMSSGRGMFHKESVPSYHDHLEMLQIIIRPHTANLTPLVSFYEFPAEIAFNSWRLIAGPEDTQAPLSIRNNVSIYDMRLVDGQLALPDLRGQTAFLYVISGEIYIPELNSLLQNGDGSIIADRTVTIKGFSECRIILLIVDTNSWFTREGIISG